MLERDLWEEILKSASDTDNYCNKCGEELDENSDKYIDETGNFICEECHNNSNI